MIIAGAGGHGLEVYSLLIAKGYPADSIYFFDEDVMKKDHFTYGGKVITDEEVLTQIMQKDPQFCLGVGNPIHRKYLSEKLQQLAGEYIPILSSSSINQSLFAESSDLMEFAFCGPEARLGKGVLVNTRAHVHHECEIGEYTEIGPGAILLGGVKVGKMCRIGAGAVLLPGIEIGDEVVVGAGAVVTKDYTGPLTIKGVPAKE
ncbi:DapH/DapD/GlmU-related protein [Algoriphagus hitonicola]|uniref:Sugar O-acyltransferase, sialic acid O-acetyltransferase NeuD family n=1 Tax=Algoriphagus hitonicola TaxID=435880 RepID=A0A1I2X4X0_9BACT|nr:DapH/DapD/GlmU-related protein [Algoriphagus hitonicola]SFH08558.1 sugar O-acyltransferase, sialic acid O-acetyltransferase NeuD family [Algoriphagus hitonicola]